MTRAAKTAPAAALVLFLLLCACPQASGREATDQAGRRVIVPERAERLVSLAPSITEIVFDLGRGDRLVGATIYSTWPEAAKRIPRVGSYVKLDLEKIVSLRPDLCLAIKDGNPEHTVERLAGLGIPVYVIDPKDMDGIIAAIRGIGAVIGAKKRAEKIAAGMRRAIDSIRARTDRAEKRPRVFFQIDAAPIISAGNGTFINELIALAGGVNVAAGPDPYPRFSWEDVIALAPEVVIIASMAGGYSPEELKKSWRRWPQIPAVRNGNLHVIDANLVDRPTPRLVEGLAAFARTIHPELFR